MSESWYPVIDSMSCTECGACIQKCNNGVYDKEYRAFTHKGKQFASPPKAMIVDGILQAVYGKQQVECCSGPYIMPDNLKQFFGGIKTNNDGSCCCDCGGNC